MSKIQRLKSSKKPYKVTFSKGSAGSRIRKIKSFKTKEEAKRWLDQVEHDFVNENIFQKSQMNFLDYYKSWVHLYKEPVVSLATLESYNVSYNHYKRYGLDNIKMADLSRDRIQNFFNGLGLAHETARKDLNHLRTCLRDAYNDGVINRNPASGTIRIVADPQRTKSDDCKFMSIKDFRKVQTFLMNYDYRLSDVNRMVLMVISQTALRVGEALALRYDDINQVTDKIRVDESWDSHNYVFKKPKTEHSFRQIPISKTAMSKVVQWMNFHRRELFRRGIKNPQQLLFLNHDAQLPNAGSINASYRQIQKRLKIESKFSTHTMRHTLASMMLASGKVSIVYIAHFLGHSSPAITQKYYIGLLPEQVENEGPKVVKIIGFG